MLDEGLWLEKNTNQNKYFTQNVKVHAGIKNNYLKSNVYNSFLKIKIKNT